jgi:hypothetical protein
MLRRLLARFLAARPSPTPAPPPPVSPLESANVDLSDLDLNSPEDLLAALRRIVYQVSLEEWRASRIPPHMRHRAGGGSLSIYGEVARRPDPPALESEPSRVVALPAVERRRGRA